MSPTLQLIAFATLLAVVTLALCVRLMRFALGPKDRPSKTSDREASEA
jgi:hypothetical protein